MSFKSIEKRTIIYSILKFTVSKAFHLFYQISVEDNSNVKDGDPIIFAPNHQNALIDPLAIIFSRKGQIIFLSRGDIFNNKIIAEVLYTIKMLPVFRIRDGFDQLHKNQAIFDKTMSVIAAGRGLGVFPEANHAGYRKLRMLKKGISRMAFQTELNYNEELNVKIVPVGMEYDHYYWFRSRIHITYGEPILVKDYIEQYKQDNPKGLNALNKAIADGIKPLMVDIQLDGDEYDAVNYLTDINFNNNNKDLALSFEERVELDKIIVKKVIDLKEKSVDIFDSLVSKVINYKKALGEVRTDDYSVGVLANKKSYKYFYPILILMFPMYLVGLILNYIPYKIPYFTTRKMPDIQFHATMYFAVGSIVVFPIFYTIYFIILQNYFSVFESFVAIVGSGVLGLFSYEYWRLYLKLKHISRAKKSNGLDSAITLRQEIIDILSKL